MMLDEGLDRTMCRSPISGCRQSAFSSKSDDGKQIRRRRTEIRRMKMSVEDPCSTWLLQKQRRFGSIDGSGSGSGSGGSNLSVPGDFRVEGTSRLRPPPTAARSSSCCSHAGVATGDAVPDTRHRSMSVTGRRREMEDAVVVQPGFVASKDGDGRKFDFYGVYDGHGGSRVALACRDGLHRLLAAEMERELERAGEMEMDWEKVMAVSFARMDEEVNETETVGATGSTAVVAVVGEEVLVVANCGDSRAVLSRGGSTVALSDDHKPDRPDELARIEDSGGRVIDWDGQRVLGVLATSRSIGDQQLKPYVISKPEVLVTRRSNMDEFLILASDGLWDVMSSEMACHVVRKCMSGRVHRRRPNGEECVVDSAAVLTELAIAKGSRDNISVIVVELNKHDP